MGYSIKEILDRYDKTLFYPYAFCEELLDREQELLTKIQELELNISNNKSPNGRPLVDLSRYSICEVDPTLQLNLMAFGLDCGEGWHPLIKELLDKLEAYIIVLPQWKHLRILQIKEKWGSLNVYTNFVTNEIETLIDEYKQKSLTICEICGKTGFLREDLSWLQTLCDGHYKEIKNDSYKKERDKR